MITRTVTKWISIARALIFRFCVCSFLAAGEVPGQQVTNGLVIQSVTVNGKTLQPIPGKELSLGASPVNILFRLGRLPVGLRPMRLRHKLEGLDTGWREGGGFMFLAIRFCDDKGEEVGFKPTFRVEGDSAGWTGTLEGSTLDHRREKVVVPPRATQWQVIISSAGPPSTVGLYVVEHLVVSKLDASHQSSEVLMRAFNGPSDDNLDPQGWVRDGIRPQMAKIIELDRDPKIKAFAILDDYPYGHAEWRSRRESTPRVAPGDNLVVEWNELYSMGDAANLDVRYDKLPQGKYQFRVEETGPFGGPTKAEVSLAVLVPVPLLEMPLFWAVLAAVAVALSGASVRYVTLQKMRRSLAKFEQQRALEQERLRIAQDIHDDLGARVTQISLVSALAQSNATSLEGARAEFDRISRMSRELVSALYETVWVVNPENDNLDAMGTFLCQKIDEFCTQARLRCRLHVVDLPQNVQISSQMRHNTSMAVKEAVHNVIKHARASLVTVHVTFSEMLLTITIQDDGCGFDATAGPTGHGLLNMKQRLLDIGGVCVVESSPGRGTTVLLSLRVKSFQEVSLAGRATHPLAASTESPTTESAFKP
jgi:signal transduction histidine kinase